MFPTMHGIEEICRDQSMARHFYHIELRGTKATNTYPIKGLDIHDDLAEQREGLVEDLIFISLVDENPEHMVRINSNLDQVIKN